jgi:Cu2+-exporting ATPase
VGLVDPDAAEQFCCEGCRLVYSVIHEHGFDRYYEMMEDLGERALPARTAGKSYEEFDDPAFHDLYVREERAPLRTVDLYLENVHCAACLWLVEKTPLVVPGVAEARLDLGRSMATMTWDPARADLSKIAAFLDSLGYPVHPFRAIKVREMRRREDRALLIRIAVAGACAANVMTMAVALYSGAFHGMAEEYEALFRWLSLAVTIPAVFWAGAVFLRGALGSLRVGTLHMDVPIAIGILVGFFSGAVNTLRGSGEIYFDSVTALIFLLLVGRYLQQRQQRAAADAAELLYSLSPSSARVVEGESTREVPVEAVVTGMIVEVHAAEQIPVDGTVTAGRSTLDRSLLTGESRPVAVEPGEEVFAGTLNLGSPLTLRVDAAGEKTRVGRLMRLVEEYARRKAPVVRLADRISAWFVAVVLSLAAITAAVWWWVDSSRALDNTIALLIVTCPCALGLATPLAVSAAIGKAGRSGILVKGGDALEQLACEGTVFLDKTGTLTEGKTSLVRWWGDDAVKPLVRAVESRVAHPVARALADAFADESPPLEAEVERVEEGAGVAGRVAGSGIVAGSPAYVERVVERVRPEVKTAVADLVGDGLTPVVIAVDGAVRGVAGIGDPIREEAAAVVSHLRDSGWKVKILSGDHPEVAAAVGTSIGLERSDCLGAVLPEQKLEIVETATRRVVTVMVGDGVNDAAALTAASVGVAVHGGAEVALSVADVFLTRPGLEPLERLFDGARNTVRVIRRNFIFSLMYNVIGAGLAVAGWIHPLAAAILMPLSSLTVITHSYRARTF